MASSSFQSGITSTIPACNPTPCAPCYYTFSSSLLDFPFDIVNETSTVSLVAYVTGLPDGSLSTSFSTVAGPTSTGNTTGNDTLTYLPNYTWEVNGKTLTYPTTYLSILDLSGKATSQWESKSADSCDPTANVSSIYLPETTDPASFIIPISPTTATDGDLSLNSEIGSSNDAFTANELRARQYSSVSTVTVTLIGGGNDYPVLPSSVLTYLDGLSTVKEQFSNVPITSCLPATSVSQPDQCTTIIEIPRTGICPGTNATSICTFEISTVTVTRTAVTEEVVTPTTATPRQTAGALTTKIQTVSMNDAFATPGSASLDASNDEPANDDNGSSGDASGKAQQSTAPSNSNISTGAQQEQSAGLANPTSSGSDARPSPAQGVPSQSAGSQSASSQRPGSPTSSKAGINASEAASSSGVDALSQPVDPGIVQSSRTTAKSGASSASSASVAPVFTFLGETLTAGGAATFGGSPASISADSDGVVVANSNTVQLPDGQATTIEQDSQEPVTISRTGSIYLVDGQTLSPGQQASVEGTTISLGTSTGVLYVNGASTTLADPSFTLAGTVYTAVETPTTHSDGGLGGYIYSGIGGSVPGSAASTGEGSANTTGVVQFTGDGSSVDIRRCFAVLGILVALVI